ncbi:MAG: hypothetical protein J5I98_06175 [Phaeodactylibacter sp.]|nr:hypothetical protein [Phaeodactylibacter sp.]
MAAITSGWLVKTRSNAAQKSPYPRLKARASPMPQAKDRRMARRVLEASPAYY